MDDNGVLWRLSGLRGPDNVHDVGNLVIGQTRRASQSVFQIASMREAVYGSSVGEQQFDKSHVRTMRCEGKSRLPKFIGRIDICSPRDQQFADLQISLKRCQHEQGPREPIRELRTRPRI